MLTDELINLSKGPLSNAFNGMPGFENVNMNDLTGAAGKSVVDAVMQQLQSGNFNSLLEMFSGKKTSENHEAVSELQNPVASDLKNQFGFSQQTAQQLAMLAIPILLNLFNQKVSDAKTGGFNINDLITQFTGNQGSGGIMQIITNLFRPKSSQTNSSQDLFQSILRRFL